MAPQRNDSFAKCSRDTLIDDQRPGPHAEKRPVFRAGTDLFACGSDEADITGDQVEEIAEMRIVTDSQGAMALVLHAAAQSPAAFPGSQDNLLREESGDVG